ncbi:hypothetical protein L0P88_18440 [Muricauda sp. SCSIO 64092]|uniref:hypothetical protein n=1 Tax=Allomuricauda sp. SCSIO 64092 TaxID=2908842 RepID=UPI001FF17390|nr:hypothetical protein [Muricauda sp. SCSIO 64092]UOY05906.1 hypothetical protein L0P88_18440 [Muricauda sp. SCSIO 64092]
MKVQILAIALIGTSLGLKAQENVLIGLNSPAYGVKIRANWVGYSGDWARGFSISNENNTQNLFEFGAIGSAIEGSSSFSYGYIGKRFDDTFMIFRADGNIGIGTTNPGTWKLAVNGNIRAKEIKVETGWPDFVFEKDYNLPTLTEVEHHIKEKGHLKDIPNATEVEENGIFLGEMDSKLLQKIEELTLYTIQQEKKITEQANEIKELKSLNSKLLELEKRLENLEQNKPVPSNGHE